MKAGRIVIYLLLFSGCSINYIDRVVLSVAAHPIAQEFGLSTVQLGYLFSAFLWTYLIFVLPWGMLVDRIGTKRSTAWGMAIWSFATVLTGVSGGFGSAILSRLLMGFGEASTYPAGARTIREWMPARERGFATTVFNCGGYAGPAIGSILMGTLVSAMGWRGGFFVSAAIGFGWMLIWLIAYRSPEKARYIGDEERAMILAERGGSAQASASAPLSALLRCTSLWGLFIVQGCAVYTVYLFLSWLPSYLQSAHGLSVLKTGFYTAVPYAVAVPGTIFMGWLSDRLLRNAPVNSGRRRNMVALLLLCSACILVTPLVHNTFVVLALFSFSLTSIGSTVGLNIALLSDLLPNPANTGRAHGFLVTGGNLFGVLAPIATGYVVSFTGSYSAAFVIAGILLVVGATVCLTMTRKPIAPATASGDVQISTTSGANV
ncbi:MFS transporter [Paraburkholderia sp. ZP32-5]|uniref:MFS transporter n=1 Tax=Paraburkholderia sp. ZP32-5 TaxID=2883245 RepID=UPI001F2EA535|nr:MFS transporter [Paraburkholderia sp. ZP32-5]